MKTLQNKSKSEEDIQVVNANVGRVITISGFLMQNVGRVIRVSG